MDALAALVPAEVLVAHGVILTAASKVSTPSNGEAVTTLTEPGTLKGSFIALVVVSMVVYAIGRTRWDIWDAVRIFIPPLAFVGWTLLQPSSAIDAFGWNITEAARVAVPVIGALVLGAVASRLAYKADEAAV